VNAGRDLPILDQLGAEFARLVEEELGAGARPERARLRERPQPVRTRGAHRVLRRATVVLVLLCLVGGVALAARFGGGDTPGHTSPTVLGHGAGSGWSLSAYRDGGRLCALLDIGDQIASHCDRAPGPAELRASSVIAGGRRFVFGLAGPRVAAVAFGPTGRRAATEVAVDDSAALAAGVPAGTRWFLLPLHSSPDAIRAPAALTPIAEDGRPLGPAILDCSLGVVGRACERAIRRRAMNAAG